RARMLADRGAEDRVHFSGWGREKALFLIVHAEQSLDPRLQLWIFATSLPEVESAILGLRDLACGVEEGCFIQLHRGHDKPRAIEDRGSRIEDRGSRIEDSSASSIFDPRSSILDSLSSILDAL